MFYLGSICAKDPASAVLVGVIRRSTTFTPVTELAQNTDFK